MSLKCGHDAILKDKKMADTDWHNANIIAQLKIKTGKSLRQLSEECGLSPKTLGQALQRPYPKAERIIAAAIGVDPQTIWPSRYNSEGQSSRRKGKRSIAKKHPIDIAIEYQGGKK
ncbi:helix-turn-helix domain-containing protein [Rheinheimera aquimaris]|uniref:helix-turn-helix domain-containing protein n=1 Tax=Rheinheimera aquimaris TaxID=412437 RepID=UPI001E559C61|nr:helix-turn-helix transcriptional regulator [Rheinheimera aquimaris]MCD1597899.1 helix-turn-helix domain-containing protein [Rheinheimera aquimaris]